MGGITSAIGGAIGGLFGGNSAAKASKDMQEALQNAQNLTNQYYQQATGYMQPFYNTGQQGLSDYASALGQMSDPTAYMNQLMSGYSMSPQAQMEQQQAIKAANAAAAATGMLGGGAEQKELASTAEQITSRDMQQYLNNLLGINQRYLESESVS